MRMYALLALAVGLPLAAAPPNDATSSNGAEKLFRAMEAKLAEAQTLTCTFDVKLDSKPYDGRLTLAPGNKVRLDINESTEGRALRVRIVSDGAHLSYQDNGLNRPTLGDVPKRLNADVLTWLARPGLFLPQAPLPDVKAQDAKDRFPVSNFQLEPEEKIGERATRQVKYRLSVKGQEAPFTVTVWIDVRSGLPVKRRITTGSGHGEIVVEEVYKTLVLAEKVDAKAFELPR